MSRLRGACSFLVACTVWLLATVSVDAYTLQRDAEQPATHQRSLLSSTGCKNLHAACKSCRVAEVAIKQQNSNLVKERSEAKFSVCTSCEDGFRLGSRAEAPCAKPGWYLDPVTKLPTPCDKGYYGPGSTAAQPEGICKKCPAGYTTQENGATSPKECTQCIPGYGGSPCTQCPYSTYSYGGSQTECEPCQPGTTSTRAAGAAEDCVQIFPLSQAATAVYLPVSDSTALENLGPGGTDSEAACESLCGSTTNCILYQYKQTDLQQCLGLLQVPASTAGRVAIGVKGYTGGTVADYAFYYIPGGLTIGASMGGLKGRTMLKQCMGACTAKDECVIVSVKGSGDAYECELFSGVLDEDYTSGYQITPSKLLGDGMVVSTA